MVNCARGILVSHGDSNTSVGLRVVTEFGDESVRSLLDWRLEILLISQREQLSDEFRRRDELDEQEKCG